MLSLSHKSLEVYQITLRFVNEVYKVTSFFPKEEKYGLTSQVRRAAISVCSNIAEGAARTSKKDKKKFYEIARSSLVETDTQFELSVILGYNVLTEIKELEKYTESIFRMLSKMINNLKPPPPLATSY